MISYADSRINWFPTLFPTLSFSCRRTVPATALRNPNLISLTKSSTVGVGISGHIPVQHCPGIFLSRREYSISVRYSTLGGAEREREESIIRPRISPRGIARRWWSGSTRKLRWRLVQCVYISWAGYPTLPSATAEHSVAPGYYCIQLLNRGFGQVDTPFFSSLKGMNDWSSKGVFWVPMGNFCETDGWSLDLRLLGLADLWAGEMVWDKLDDLLFIVSTTEMGGAGLRCSYSTGITLFLLPSSSSMNTVCPGFIRS